MCEKCCLPYSCSTARRLMFGNELAKARTNSHERCTKLRRHLTASTDHRRWDTHESQTTQHGKAAGTQRITKPLGLQSGERASTIRTTQNTCSSPGYPVTIDLSHFNSNPHIWCRGPRPRAHWYMHTDGTNYSKCHSF